MPITRRALSGAMTFLALTGSVFVLVDKSQTGGSFAQRLQRDLTDWTRRHAPSSRATVVGPGMVALASGGVEMSVRISLDWPPGMRLTPYVTSATDSETAYRGLRDRVLTDMAALHGVSQAGST